MQAAIERIRSLSDSTRSHNSKRVRFSLIVALLLAALLWRTTWPSLRPGLIILLLGYLGSAGLFAYRNMQLTKEASRMQTESGELLAWFDRQEKFAIWSTRLDTGLRTAGFLVLGYGFWLATHSDVLALLLGIGYPAVTYFGMERRNNQRARNVLKTEKEAMSRMLGQ